MRNNTKKICVHFGLIPRNIISDELFRPTQLNSSLPHVDGNCTWIDDPRFPRGVSTLAQILFTSSDEKKVMRIVNKYGGEIIQIREDLNQNMITEVDPSGKINTVELATEVIPGLNPQLQKEMRYNVFKLKGQYNGTERFTNSNSK